MHQPHPNFDAIWKETFQEFFPECLDRFYPPVAGIVDGSKTVRFLDKVLREMMGYARRSWRYGDES